MPKRRTKGDGGLTQRHSADCPPVINGIRADHNCTGRWQGTIDVIEAGVRRRKYVYGRTQKEARLKLDQAKREKSAGTLVVATQTVDKWLTQWLERQKTKLKPASHASYSNKVDKHIRPHLGRHRLTSLHPDHIDAMYEAMRAQGLSEATLRTTHRILSKCLRDAVKRGILALNPLERVDAPTTETNSREPLTIAEARQVLAYTDNARWWLALFYGMRQGEVLGLRWCDINWTHNTIRVQQTLQLGDFGVPKSKASARTIPMLPLIEARLRLHWINEGRPVVGTPCNKVTGICEHGLVFHVDGRPVVIRTDNRHWHQLLADATTPPWAPIKDTPGHAARNTAASVMEAAGIPERMVMQILGHSQVQTTHGYQTAELDRMRDALNGVNRVLELG